MTDNEELTQAMLARQEAYEQYEAIHAKVEQVFRLADQSLELGKDIVRVVDKTIEIIRDATQARKAIDSRVSDTSVDGPTVNAAP